MPRFPILFIAILGLAGPATAAVPPMSLRARPANSANAMATLSITSVDAICTLRDGLARTTVTLTLAVETPDAQSPPQAAGTLDFFLPPDCMVTGAALDLGDLMRQASLTSRWKAEIAY